MPKDLTAKDVLYALEYTRAEMVREPGKSMGSRPSYHLHPTGERVKESVALEVRGTAGVGSVADRNGRQVFFWRAVA